ncbi:MAG: hypothetical protein WC763_06080 [Candidatus Paceibacterota bacterium]|jgi:hypothetical protein
MMKVNVHENGIVEFVLIDPLPADKKLRVDPEQLALALAEVERYLVKLEIKTNAPPAMSFRPLGDEFEMYRLTAAVPGTVQMRQARKGWPPRKKK